MSELYSIFTVEDYKGGELHTDLNTSRQAVVRTLADHLRYKDYKLDDLNSGELDEIVSTGQVTIKVSSSAGGDDGGFCGAIYRHEETGLLKRVSVNDFFAEVIEYIKQLKIKEESK